MEKSEVYRIEHAKLTEMFNDVDPNISELAEELIKDAARLTAESFVLMQAIEITGMVRINPKNPNQQIKLPAGEMLLKIMNTKSVVYKNLGSLANKNLLDEDDEFDKYMRERRTAKQLPDSIS